LLDLIRETKFGILSLIPTKTYSLLHHPVVSDVASELNRLGYSVERISALRIESRYRTAKYFLDEIAKVPDRTALIIDGLFLYGFGRKHRRSIEKLVSERDVRVYLLTAIPHTLLRKYAVFSNKADVIYSEYGENERDKTIELKQYHGKGAKVADVMVDNVLYHVNSETKVIAVMGGRREIAAAIGERICSRLKNYKLVKATIPGFTIPEGSNVVVAGVMYPIKILHKADLVVLAKERPKKIGVLEVLYRTRRFGTKAISLYQVFEKKGSRKTSSSKQVKRRESPELEEYRSYGSSVAIIRLDGVEVVEETSSPWLGLKMPVLYIPSFLLVDENGVVRRFDEINPKEILLKVLKLPLPQIKETDDVNALIEHLSNNQTLRAYTYFALKDTKYAGIVKVLPDTEISKRESIKLLRELFFETPQLFRDPKFIGVLNSLIAVTASEDPNIIMKSTTIQNHVQVQFNSFANAFTKNTKEIEYIIRERMKLTYLTLRQIIASRLSIFAGAIISNIGNIVNYIERDQNKTYLKMNLPVNDTFYFKRADEVRHTEPIVFQRPLRELQKIEVEPLDDKPVVPGHDNRAIRSCLLNRVIKVGDIVVVNGRSYRVKRAVPRWEGVVGERTEVYIVQERF